MTDLAQRLIRYADLRPCRNAFIDTRSPGSEAKENFTQQKAEPAGRSRSARPEPSRSGSSSNSSLGGRPSAWCGWYMRTRHGGGPEMNLAWNWSRYGSATSPQIGAIVVWRHHVGEIVGQASNGQWIVLSGNDGGQVRSRARSIAGAVVRI